MRASSENRDEPIPLNIDLSEEQKKSRQRHIYDPYRNAIKHIIKKTRQKHGGVIVLDLHSFSPTWQGQKRDVQIGTLAFGQNPMEREIVKYLEKTCSTNNLTFTENQPYNLSNLIFERTEPARFIQKCNVWYTGLEIRNDLLKDPNMVQQIANIIENTIEQLKQHPDKDVFMRKKTL